MIWIYTWEAATTLEAIEKMSPCKPGWKTLLRGLRKKEADAEPLSFKEIYNHVGWTDMVWCLRAVPELSRFGRKFAIWCAKECAKTATSEIGDGILDVSDRYMLGQATKADLKEARDRDYMALSIPDPTTLLSAFAAIYTAHDEGSSCAYLVSTLMESHQREFLPISTVRDKFFDMLNSSYHGYPVC